MSNLHCEYLGLKLANPLVPSASPLSKDLATARKLEDAGASAVVMYSLFEEKIAAEQHELQRFIYEQQLGHAEADSFHPLPDQLKTYHERYLENLQSLKSGLAIPVIASLNGVSAGGWIDYGQTLQQAGADALELNIYTLPANPDQSSAEVEQQYLQIVRTLKSKISIPLTVKLSAQFSAPLHFAKALQQAGADGIVLFNRFYQPDIDLDSLQLQPKLELSSPAEALLRIRWTALLFGQTSLSLAVTGGFHHTPDVIKALLAGADVVHVCSALLQAGPKRISEILQELTIWLDSHEYESIRQLKGSVSHRHAINPGVYERANYIEVLDSYSPAPGVWF